MAQPDPIPADNAEEPGIFDVEDPEWEARCDAEAEADIAAGRVISHEAVSRWLLSWGTANELPPPKCGE